MIRCACIIRNVRIKSRKYQKLHTENRLHSLSLSCQNYCYFYQTNYNAKFLCGLVCANSFSLTLIKTITFIWCRKMISSLIKQKLISNVFSPQRSTLAFFFSLNWYCLEFHRITDLTFFFLRTERKQKFQRTNFWIKFFFIKVQFECTILKRQNFADNNGNTN